MPVSNKFTKAMRHLRSTQIDERIRALNEGPTNNTSGYYVIEPDIVTVIPAVRSDLDLEADDPSLAGKDTSGLFDESGNPLTEMPPGDTSFILGPMVSVYFPDGDYSAIGYIQQDTRKVVNLARIPGPISGWGVGGNVEGFTSYSQLTLEQALWYRDKLINGNTSTYRVFYVGVFEQLQSESDVTDPSAGVDIDEYGRWEGEVIDQGEILEPERTEVEPGKKGPDPDLPPGSANPNLSLRGSGLAMIGAMDLDQSVALWAGIIGGAGWAIQQLINLGLRSDADVQDAMIILQSNIGGDAASLDPTGEIGIEDDYSDSNNERTIPPATPGEKLRDKHEGEMRDADQKLADAEAQYGQDSDEAQQARQDRNDLYGKQRKERKAAGVGPQYNSYNPKGNHLFESKRNLLREIKKPYVLPEVKQEKIKHRPKVNYSGKQNVVGDGLMKKAEVPTSFKRLEDTMWKKQERAQNERFSQERKNMILDSIGTSDHAWNWMTEKSHTKSTNSMYENFNTDKQSGIISKKKIGNDYVIKMYNEEGKVEIVTQSVLNERLQKKHELKEQETLNAPNDPLVKRIRNKLRSQIDYPDKPSKMGYPDQAPYPLSVTGYHMQYGKRKDYYKRLDRHSADTMDRIRTGNYNIDMNVLVQTTVEKIKQMMRTQRKNK